MKKNLEIDFRTVNHFIFTSSLFHGFVTENLLAEL